MRRWFFVAFAVGGLALAAARATSAAEPDRLMLVVNTGSNNVTFLDQVSGELLGNVPVGVGPRDIAVTPDGRRAYVSNFGDHRNTLTVIDVAEMAAIEDIAIKNYYRPHGIAVSRDGKNLFVTTEGTNALVELSLPSGKLTRAFHTGMRGPHLLALAGSHLVAVNTFAGNVTIFDLATGERIRHVLTGTLPEGAAVSPDGKEIWVANRGNATVAIIDSETLKVASFTHVHGKPIRVAFIPGAGKALVSCADRDVVALIDTETRKTEKVIKTGMFPLTIVVDPAVGNAYVANNGSNNITVIDLSTFESSTKIATGKNPFGLACLKTPR